MTNFHAHDRAVWEIFRRGEGNHTYRWEQTPSQALEVTIPVPAWPMDLVWVGHRTRAWNPDLDGNTGWTLDWQRLD